ncbi:general substrate transporter [Cystobasidium minutum MCA 4210]|uniref:general substrate transporter n=1 Tax=Cystobasidium minutum MCA 4210 TaxID=1397322 RepID=UPI0034CD3191|eukprot:jgi/Rhomi1/154232/estExt_Genewise1.C_5_t20275
MTGWSRAPEDRPTPPQVYNARVYLAACIISMGVLTYGYDSAFIGTTITQKSFQTDFGLASMTKSEKDAVSSNLTSIYSAGGFFGALFSFFVLELMGRKPTLIISNVIFVVGAVLCTAPSSGIGIIYAGRLLTGLGVGGIAAAAPGYISEIAPPAIRGRLTGFFESFYQCGPVVGFWINYGIVHNVDTTKSVAWRIPMAVQLIPAGLLALGLPFLKESPVYLIKRGKLDQAYKNLSYLRNLPADHEYIEQDVQFVRRQLEDERSITGQEQPTFGAFLKSASKECFTKGIRNRFLLVFLMFMWQAWSGAAAINYYSPTIFRSIGLSDYTLWTGIYGIIKAAGSIVFYYFFIDKVGRRAPWIASSLSCAVCQFYLAGYIAVGKPSLTAPQSASTIAGGKAATFFIMLFGLVWSFGANGLPWLIGSEIFPTSVRAIAGPWAAMSVWLWTFVVTKALPSMYTSMGYGVYIFFASMLILASIYAWFYIPETKGLRIDQCDALFGFVRKERPALERGTGSIDSSVRDDHKVDITDKV